MVSRLFERLGLKKINELIGVDIGTSSIKVCVLAKTKKGMRMSRLAKKTYKESLLNDGNIIDQDFVARELKKILSENEVKCKTAACALSSYCVITKKAAMPLLEEMAVERSVKVKSDESLIVNKVSVPLFDDESIIETEVSNIIPFPMNEINYGYQITGMDEDDESMVNILIVAAKKEVVEGFVKTFEMAGLDLVILDVDIFALTNLVEQIYNPQQSVVVVDIGASVTNMVILKRETIEFTREILLGGRYLTEQIEKSINVPFEIAEDKKISGDEEIFYLFEDFIFNISSEINKTINFYISTNPNDAIEKVFISGGSSLLKSMKEKISEYTNIEVEYIDPFLLMKENFNEDISQNDLYIDYKEFNGIALMLSSRIQEIEI